MSNILAILNLLLAIKLIVSHPLIYFFGARNVYLFPLESALMKKFEESLDPDIKNVVQEQLNRVNLIERVSNSKTVVSFSRIENFLYSQNKGRKIASDKDEWVIRKIDFVVDGSKL